MQTYRLLFSCGENMENINKLICYLMAIQYFSKDIHYTCYGDAFYGKHLLADRIHNGLSDFIDQLKETCLLGNDILPLSSLEYSREMDKYLIAPKKADDKANFLYMQRLLTDALVFMQEMLEDDNTPRAEVALVDNIAQDLQQKLGLVNLQVR